MKSSTRARTEALYARFLSFQPRKGDFRKIAILETAIDLIATKGIEAASHEALGRPNGMTKAHVAYYFSDRDAIIEAAIQFVVATAQSYTIDHVRAAKTDKARLPAFVNGTFAWIHDFPKHGSVILLLHYYASHVPRLRRLHSRVRKLGSERLHAVVDPLLPKSRRRQGHHIARVIQSLITGNLIDQLTTQSKETLDAACKRTIKEVDAVFSAYSQPALR